MSGPYLTEASEAEARAEHEMDRHALVAEMAERYHLDRGYQMLDSLAASGAYDEDMTP